MRRAGTTGPNMAEQMRSRLQREAAQRQPAPEAVDQRLGLLQRRLDELREHRADLLDEQRQAERQILALPAHGGLLHERLAQALRQRLDRLPELLTRVEEQVAQAQADVDRHIRWHRS